MVKAERKARFWAWSVSVAIHVCILAVFAAAKLSQSEAEARESAAVTVTVRSPVAPGLRTTAIPKPKMKESVARPGPLAEAEFYSGPQRIVRSLQAAPGETVDFERGVVVCDIFSLADAEIAASGAEFFGSRSQGRRICYVVDCSGSMRGLLGRVKVELSESIGDLQADQYFAIFFFGGGRVLKFNDGNLARATESAKSSAFEFINSVSASGSTNAAAAIEEALKVRGAGGMGASAMYFLTDGFEPAAEDAGRFCHRIETLRRSFGAGVKINTIGFWPSSEDEEVLQRIAHESGGECALIGDGDI